MKTIIPLLLLLVLACESEPQAVAISKFDGHIIIRNNTATPVYYAAFDREVLALIEWDAFCQDNKAIPPSQSAALSLSEFPLTTTNDIVVFWWSECVQDPGSGVLRGHNVKSVIVSK